jgi:hypothetical protein
MDQESPVELTPEEAAALKAQIITSAKGIHEKCEALMADIEDYIALTDGDLALVMDDLKRVDNFLEAVIEAHPIRYTIAEIMDKLALDEATIRQLFIQVGVDLDPSANNAEETVIREDVIALLADRAGSREGDLLADFLRGDSPRIVCG